MNRLVILVLALIISISFSCKKQEDKDITPPIINLLGNIYDTIPLGATYIDSGYTATDDIDGDISTNVIITGSVNELVIGTYQLHYNVADNAGNKASEKIRTIVVEGTLMPQNIQNGFAIEYTATWDQFSGGWGAILLYKYAADAPNGAIIAAHLSGDPMKSQLSYSFVYDRNHGGGIPSFYVGNNKTTDANAMSNLMNTPTNCGIDYQYALSADSIYVYTKTKFFSPLQGDYYLSVLILEDSIDGSSNAATYYTQKGTSTTYPNDDYLHNFVLRASSVKDSAYGELLTQNPTLNMEVDKSYTIVLDPLWQNPYPVCIIWKYIAGAKPEYHYINSLKRKNP